GGVVAQRSRLPALGHPRRERVRRPGQRLGLPGRPDAYPLNLYLFTSGVQGAKPPGRYLDVRLFLWTRSSRALILTTFQSSNQLSSRRLSISEPPKRSASRCRQRCSRAPSRSLPAIWKCRTARASSVSPARLNGPPVCHGRRAPIRARARRARDRARRRRPGAARMDERGGPPTALRPPFSPKVCNVSWLSLVPL